MSTQSTSGAGARPPPESLLPEELREHIPSLYTTEHCTDPVVQAKLFAPWSTWSWFITEFDGQETCFGLVSGLEVELGYFNLADPSCTYQPEAGVFDPVPRFSWGARQARACADR